MSELSSSPETTDGKLASYHIITFEDAGLLSSNEPDTQQAEPADEQEDTTDWYNLWLQSLEGPQSGDAPTQPLPEEVKTPLTLKDRSSQRFSLSRLLTPVREKLTMQTLQDVASEDEGMDRRSFLSRLGTAAGNTVAATTLMGSPILGLGTGAIIHGIKPHELAGEALSYFISNTEQSSTLQQRIQEAGIENMEEYINKSAAQLGVKLLDKVRIEQPEILVSTPNERNNPEYLQPSDKKPYENTPPENMSFYFPSNVDSWEKLGKVETEGGPVERITQGIIQLYESGQFAFPDADSLTGREKQQKSSEMAERLWKLMHTEYTSVRLFQLRLRTVNDLNPNHPREHALLQDSHVVEEMMEYLKRTDHNIEDSLNIDLTPVIDKKTSGDGWTYDFDPQLEAYFTRKSYVDFEAAYRKASSQDFSSTQSVPRELNEWINKHFPGWHNDSENISFYTKVFTALAELDEDSIKNMMDFMTDPKGFIMKLQNEDTEETQDDKIESPIISFLEQLDNTSAPIKTPTLESRAAVGVAGAGMISYRAKELIKRLKEPRFSRRTFLKGATFAGATLGFAVSSQPATATLFAENELMARTSPEMWEVFYRRLDRLMQEPFLEGVAGTHTIRAADGTIIHEVFPEKDRLYFSLDKLQQDSPKAYEMVLKILKAEDRDFMNHHGINGRGVLAAVTSNAQGELIQQLTGEDYTIRGASSITQLVIENLLDFNGEDTALPPVERKHMEMLLATAWEKALEERFKSKRKAKQFILEQFLNLASFGPNKLGQNMIGLKTASREFFGKEVAELTEKEMCVLATTWTNPGMFSPLIDMEETQRGINALLTNLTTNGVITLDEAKQINTQECVISSPIRDNAHQEFALYTLNSYLNNVSSVHRLEGLDVTTSLDLELQQELISRVNAYKEQLERFDAEDMAVVIRNENGEILAFYGPATEDRMVASTAKLATVAASYEMGLVSDDIENPPDREVLSDRPIAIPLPDGTQWEPTNYNNSGTDTTVSLSTALGTSWNRPFIHILHDKLGNVKLWEMFNRLGVRDDIAPSIVPWSDTLGVFKSNALRLASLAGVMVNGERTNSAPIQEAKDQYGKVIYSHPEGNTSKQQVIDSFIAKKIRLILSNQNKQSRLLRSLPDDIFLKTGTSSSLDGSKGTQDNWTIGGAKTKNGGWVSLAVWVGNKTDPETGESRPMNSNAIGSELAAPFFIDLAKYIQAK